MCIRDRFSQVLVGIVNVVTTVIAVFIIDKVGRKKLVYYGVSGMVLSLLLIGFYFHFSEDVYKRQLSYQPKRLEAHFHSLCKGPQENRNALLTTDESVYDHQKLC